MLSTEPDIITMQRGLLLPDDARLHDMHDVSLFDDDRTVEVVTRCGLRARGAIAVPWHPAHLGPARCGDCATLPPFWAD